jgi:peptidyl-prolyl cis-trans isomerase C
MRKFTFPLFLIPFCVVAAAGCSQSSSSPDTRPVQMSTSGQIAETVNGTPVPQVLLEVIARGHNLHLDKPDQREQALKLTTDLVLMAQAAQRDNFFADVQFQADVEAARLKGVADAGIATFEKQTPIGDDVLTAQYNTEVGQAGKFEYDFSQLLFANEDDALKAADDALSGKTFPQVFDAWRGKAKQAKAFSRVRLDQLPQSLAQTLAAMKNGETTKVPVKTEFGWHVVHLDIANPFTPPPFEQVKEGIRRTMLMKISQQRLEKLREQAKVEYPAGTAPPAVKPGAPPPTAEEKPAAGK